MVTSEVSVVAGDDGVLLSLLHVLSVPLTDAGAAGVGQHDSTELPHGVGQAVPLDGGADLLAAGGDVERALRLEALVQRLLHKRGHAAHVLVAGVGAGPDEAVLDLQRPAVLLGSVTQLRDGGGEVGGEGSVDVRLQGAQVDLHHLVVLAVSVRAEEGAGVLPSLVCSI